MNCTARVLSLQTLSHAFQSVNILSYFELCAKSSHDSQAFKIITALRRGGDAAKNGASAHFSAVNDLHNVRFIRRLLVGAVDDGDLAASLAELELLGVVDHRGGDGVRVSE